MVRSRLRQALAPESLHKPDIGSLLLVPCWRLPLQHLCNITSAWGHIRLRWHLDMVHDLLFEERSPGGHPSAAARSQVAATGQRGQGQRGGQCRDSSMPNVPMTMRRGRRDVRKRGREQAVTYDRFCASGRERERESIIETSQGGVVAFSIS